MTYTTHSEEETQAFAARLASALQPGDVVALFGGLGAGKTTFVRGLAKGLGLDENQVSSPTFALVHEYRKAPEGPPVLCHFDMYRVQGEDALYATGFDDYQDQGCFLAVEWSENIREFLPGKALLITLEYGPGETGRNITVKGGREHEHPGP